MPGARCSPLGSGEGWLFLQGRPLLCPWLAGRPSACTGEQSRESRLARSRVRNSWSTRAGAWQGQGPPWGTVPWSPPSVAPVSSGGTDPCGLLRAVIPGTSKCPVEALASLLGGPSLCPSAGNLILHEVRHSLFVKELTWAVKQSNMRISLPPVSPCHLLSQQRTGTARISTKARRTERGCKAECESDRENTAGGG